MNKNIIAGAVILLLAVSGWALFFFLENFSGASPALFESSQDIDVLIREDEAPLSYPDEFELSVFAAGLAGPRVMAFDPQGTMLVSLTGAGKVIALPDNDNNGRADRIVEIIDNLNRPHGLAFSREAEPKLYIAETSRVTAYEYDPHTLKISSPVQIAALPGGGGHSTRTLLFRRQGDNNQLLISVGSSCNVCAEEDWRRAKILSIVPEDGSLETFASGLRNAVFMVLHHRTGEVWVTEMGRDYLGDDLPPDEINIIHQGNDYGWPSCYGKNVPDIDYLGRDAAAETCRDKIPALINIQAHSAPLGLDFFSADGGWPEKYRGSLLVAYHGSWNRSIPTGYKVVLFRFDAQGNPLGREDFVSGWLRDRQTSIGRPVDVKIRDGNSIYISDDKAGVIYRMALKPEKLEKN